MSMGWMKVLFVTGIDVVFQRLEMHFEQTRFAVYRLPIPDFLEITVKEEDRIDEAEKCWNEGIHMYQEWDL